MSYALSIRETSLLIDAIIKCSGEDGLRLPLLIHGKHGIGKTQMCESYARSVGMNCKILHLSTQDVCDLIGRPIIEISADGTSITTFAKPKWFQDILDDPRPCMVVLDEINRGQKDVRQTMLPFVLSGMLHTHKLRPNDIVVATMNPDSADYDVENFDDAALLSRFLHVYLQPEMSEYIQFLRNDGINSGLLKFLSESGKPLFDKSTNIPNNQYVHTTYDNRMCHMLMKVMTNVENKKWDINHDTVRHMAYCGMGLDVGSTLMKFFNTTRVLSLTNVMTGDIFNDAEFNPNKNLDVVDMINNELAQRIIDKTIFNGDHFGKKITKPKRVEQLKKWCNLITKDSLMGMIGLIKESTDVKSWANIIQDFFNTIDPELLVIILQVRSGAMYSSALNDHDTKK